MKADEGMQEALLRRGAPLGEVLPPKGTKLLVGAGIACFLAVLALTAILAYMLFIELQGQQLDHLGAFDDTVILNRVPGLQGAAAKEGDVVTYRGTRCAAESTKIEQVIYYQPEPSGRAVVTPMVTLNLPAGCMTSTGQVPMPEEVEPGQWYLRGVVRDKRSGELRSWNSEIFQVVKP